MGKQSTINYVTSVGGGDAGTRGIYNAVSTCLLAGWTVKSFGTGSGGTYSATGAGWSYASLTFNINGPWVRMQDPLALREITFQLFNNGASQANNLRAKYSAAAKFTSGSPSATVTPSASDETVFVGGGTDASPTGSTIFSNSTQMRNHCVAYDSPVNGVYPFYFWAHTNGATTLQSVIMLDALIAGSADATDVDPCVVYASTGPAGTGRFWTGFGTGGQAIATMTLPASQLCFDGARAVDPTSSKDVAGRMAYYSATIFKGYSHGVLLKGQARAHPNTILQTTDCRAYLGAASAGWLLPFPDNQTPLL